MASSMNITSKIMLWKHTASTFQMIKLTNSRNIILTWYMTLLPRFGRRSNYSTESVWPTEPAWPIHLFPKLKLWTESGDLELYQKLIKEIRWSISNGVSPSGSTFSVVNDPLIPSQKTNVPPDIANDSTDDDSEDSQQPEKVPDDTDGLPADMTRSKSETNYD